MENFFWGVIIILIVFLVYVILQLKRTLRTAEDFIITTQASLHPLLHKLDETIDKLNNVAVCAEESFNDVQHLTKAIGETGVIINDINHFVKKTEIFLAAGTSGLVAGIKAAFAVLTKGAFEKITSPK